MGASLVYLEKPNKDINFDEGESEDLKFVAGEMQGWRINMVSYSLESDKKIIAKWVLIKKLNQQNYVQQVLQFNNIHEIFLVAPL